MNKAGILIVEDENRLADVLRKQFNENGFVVDIASDGYAGKEMAANNPYNLIILDINLPYINGYDLCKEIRSTNVNVPIIMLTALSTPDNKITAFNAGADDYVTKPFDFRELLARVNVFLRRSEIFSEDSTLRIADLELNTSDKTVTRSGIKIDLTAKEYQLLEFLVRNKGKVLSREFIIEQVWGLDFDPGTNVIDVYVNYVRRKVDKEFEPKLIHTRYGFGFYCSETLL
jgi:DNA-binding response OmpR family regulator